MATRRGQGALFAAAKAAQKKRWDVMTGSITFAAAKAAQKMQALAALLGLSESELDALFIYAGGVAL